MMETTKEHVYAAGDVTGGYQLTPVARMEGNTAARNMANITQIKLFTSNSSNIKFEHRSKFC